MLDSLHREVADSGWSKPSGCGQVVPIVSTGNRGRECNRDVATTIWGIGCPVWVLLVVAVFQWYKITMDDRGSVRAKFVLNVLLLILPFLYLGYILADRIGVWDRLERLDLVEHAATNFELSYAPDASTPVRLGDKEWAPLLKLTYKYSNAQFPNDKQPLLFARFVAISSGRTPSAGPILAEWTAPSTPLALLYHEWPGHGDIQPADYRVVGTVGDLREWISKAKDYRRFLVQDVFLGTFTPLLGFALFWIDWKKVRG